ncbi:MAG: DJ-1/PfpI family protein [Malacoplasma sp.]|nr:DJ-1/PfpI family protein [Malacoplasma sp.]
MMVKNKIANIRIAVMIANESEDMEVTIPIDIWRRAGLIIELVSVEKKNTIILQSGTKIYCNETIDKTNLDQFNAIYLPGGRGYVKFKDMKLSEKLIRTLKKFAADEKKWIFAICAAPSLLGEFELLKNEKVTVYPGFEKPLGKNYVDKDLVVDGNFITARGAAHSYDLAFTVVENFLGKEIALNVANDVFYKLKK